MKKSMYFALCALVISSIVFACKKKKTEEPTPAANVAPTVAITFPLSGTGYSISGSDTTMTITANASDSDGTISKVEFYVNNVKAGEDVTSPYSLAYIFVLNNDYTIKAVATDDDGATTTSAQQNTGISSN